MNFPHLIADTLTLIWVFSKPVLDVRVSLDGLHVEIAEVLLHSPIRLKFDLF